MSKPRPSIDISAIEDLYQSYESKVPEIRTVLGRPLTLAEKVLFVHLDPAFVSRVGYASIERGKTFAQLRPDRVAMQDATAQMAMLQFLSAGKKQVSLPSSIHCDHLIRAHVGAEKDLLRAVDDNAEVYAFLESAAKKCGLDFWKPGSGIIHQVVLENYAFPGGMMIGTDSHTPNAGGMAMTAIGVGGADAAEVMAGLPWTVTWPKLVGVKLTGSLSGWAAPKDIILKVCELLTVKGGTGKIVEYFGSGVSSISLTGRATITNMGAELGATTSIFPYDERTASYLKATERSRIAELAKKYSGMFQADEETAAEPGTYYDELIEIDLDTLEPHMVGPHTPDLARPISKLAQEVHSEGYPDDISSALIGSCTNSSYEDIGRAVSLAEQAKRYGVKAKTPFLITPGSEQVRATIERDGMLQKLTEIGGTVLANACGPCIGQWDRDEIKNGQTNTIVTSYNRNFKKRNDGNAETLAFIGSPEIVTALALSGKLSFNPMTDALEGADGKSFTLTPPTGDELPKGGFTCEDLRYEPPASDPESVEIVVAPESKRLALLEPFPAWDGNDFLEMPVLVKALGKCTTDHISPAGPWLRFRGHLNNISDNLYSGAINAFSKEAGHGKNIFSGDSGTFSDIARAYQAAGHSWVAVGDDNYGEGSSREHAAMEVRYLGGRAVIAKSFARIAETNLKKQGVLALHFVNPDDYGKIQENDRLSVTGLASFAPGRTLTLKVQHEDGSAFETEVRHTYTQDEIAWFKAGSVINTIRD